MSLTHIPTWQLLTGPEALFTADPTYGFSVITHEYPPPHFHSKDYDSGLFSEVSRLHMQRTSPSPSYILWVDINVLHLGVGGRRYQMGAVIVELYFFYKHHFFSLTTDLVPESESQVEEAGEEWEP